MKKIIKLCEYILFILFLGMILFTKEKLTTLLIIPILPLIYLFIKKVKIKRYGLFIFVLALLIRLFTIFILKVEITDDFKTMYDASTNLIKGNLDFMNGFYFKTYPYQLGLVLYQAFLLKIINNVIILKIMNSIITSLIVLFIYLISKKIYKEEYARMISLGYILYLYPIYLNSVLTNQHIQTLIIMLVIYLVITKKETKKLFIVLALLLGIANFFRSESIVIILGLVLYSLIFSTKKNYKTKLINIIILLFVYFLFTNLTTFLLNISPLFKNTNEETTIDKNVKVWKFYCGLNTEHNGIYNNDDAKRYFNTRNEEKLLLDRIKKDKFKFPILFIKKEVILWTQTNYDLRINNNFNKEFYNLLLKFNQAILNLTLLLFVIGLFPIKKETKKEIIFIKLLIGLYFGVYLFIEISPRYAYILHILIFIILASSIKNIEFIKDNINKKISKS
ncbi:MAG: hypothetical protein HFJ11_05910 [Bacilli bacterium]|nr:hypothetical protein [Bacilli bacterium]